jgi:hypothetical protein
MDVLSLDIVTAAALTRAADWAIIRDNQGAKADIGKK